MFHPRKFNLKRSVEVSCGLIGSKCSKSGKEWSLHVEPPKYFKGPPSDFASLSGKNEAGLDNCNIYESEFIRNEPGDILTVNFEGYILNQIFNPEVSDNDELSILLDFLQLYKEKNGFDFHASALFENIINFRPLRRNNETFPYKRKLIFSTSEFNHEFTLPDGVLLPTLDQIKYSETHSIQECIEFIRARLSEKHLDCHFEVNMELRTGRTLTIFPSQELVIKESKHTNSDKSGSKKKGRTFYKTLDTKTGRRTIPIITDRQILHSLFIYDKFYSEDLKKIQPININPCGLSMNNGKYMHHRDLKKGNCVYNYQRRIIELTKELSSIKSSNQIPGHIHYLIGCYLRGGVYGEKE